MKRTRKLSSQVEKRFESSESTLVNNEDVAFDTVISTGSTLLDLAISGGRIRGGGIPGGIFVEIFGPSGSGKTVLLCELAGDVRRKGGQIMFRDPEARLNKEFARLFGLNIDDGNVDYALPDTVPQVFEPIRSWDPSPADKIHGIFADSLAALSTELELEDKDMYGTRRSKEFSTELRKSCRIVAKKGFLLVCSNQVRMDINAGPYGQKYRSPGGLGIGYYASLRLRFSSPQKIKHKIKKETRVIGVSADVEVYKSSIWKPNGIAPVTILFDYGIDDIRQNLQFLKRVTDSTVYRIGDEKLSNSLDEAVVRVEESGLEKKLQDEVIDLWEEVEMKFRQNRKPKHGQG